MTKLTNAFFTCISGSTCHVVSGTTYAILEPHVSAISLLLYLEAAQQGRSMLFSDEQKLLFEGGKKGFVKNTKLDFMRC
jgi:hypothetical protein